MGLFERLATHFLPDERTLRALRGRYAAYFHGRVLDVGCGRGEFLEALRDAGVWAMGIDSAWESITRCREKGLNVIGITVQEFLRHPINQRFDGAFLGHIIEHLVPMDAVEMIQRIFDITNPGGNIVILTPNPEVPDVIGRMFWLDVTHIRPYPILLLQAILQGVGYEVLEAGISPDLPDEIFIVGRKPGP